MYLTLVRISLAVVGCLAVLAPARAGIILTVQTTTGAAGSSGNTLQITLTNDDPNNAIDVSGFNFLIDSISTDINLTSADFSTVSPYIFAGNSFDQDNMIPLNSTSGQSLEADDNADNAPFYAIVGPGATVGLADVIFDVAANAISGLDTILFDTSSANTSVSDQNGMAIPIDSFVNGGVIVSGTSSVPEPAALWLMLGGLSVLLFLGVRRGPQRV